MKFMLILASDPVLEPDPTSPHFEAYMEEWAAYSQALETAGIDFDGEALRGAETATTVRVRDGERIVTDGPFIESKEVFGGYYIIDVTDLDAALDWAAKIPNAGFGTVEVRPVMALH
ncbi:MAG: YciI family protein [Euzebya sp.]